VKSSFKKGVTTSYGHEDRQNDQRIKNTKMITDLFDLNKIMKMENSAVKSYKDSYYVG